MKQIIEGSLEHTLQLLNKAKEATLEEQDMYRTVTKKYLSSEGENEIGEKYIKGGWGMVLKAMADCKHPPVPGDRKHYLKVGWEEELNYISLQKIKDEQIRCITYHLNSLIEHTQRLRSMAMFAERIGSLQGKGGILFSLWSQNSGMQIMLEETGKMGKEEEAEAIRQLCQANDCLAQFILEIEWDQETISKATLAAIEEHETTGSKWLYRGGTTSPGGGTAQEYWESSVDNPL